MNVFVTPSNVTPHTLLLTISSDMIFSTRHVPVITPPSIAAEKLPESYSVCVEPSCVEPR
ncbi:MAG: hypothetical protein LBI74_02140 [Synergistaceae bacterium]|nr:hypothetical protein [Synergistaceae bacterium]